MSDQTSAGGGGRGDDPPPEQRLPPPLLPLTAYTPFFYRDDVEVVVLLAFAREERHAFADAESRVQKAIRHGDHDSAMQLREQSATHMARLQELNALLRIRGADAIVGPMVTIL